jgi:hypothetical protein
MSALAMNAKEQRVKYIRALERFLGSCAGALKNETFDIVLFERRVEKSLKVLRKVEPVRLDSTYMALMQDFVTLVIQTLGNSDMQSDVKHRTLLKEANLIEKERNKGSYKKSKHSKSDFEDGY